MRYKLTINDRIIALESELYSAESQAKYYLRKAEDVDKIDIIEVQTGVLIKTIDRNCIYNI